MVFNNPLTIYYNFIQAVFGYFPLLIQAYFSILFVGVIIICIFHSVRK